MESYTKDSIINTLKINWKLIEKLKRVRLIEGYKDRRIEG